MLLHPEVPAKAIESLAYSLACSGFPAPRAFPTLTLPATLKPIGHCPKKNTNICFDSVQYGCGQQHYLDLNTLLT